MIVGRIYRFEELDVAWPNIWLNAGMKSQPPVPKRLNASQRRRNSKYYSERAIRVVRQLYWEIFYLLAYSKVPHWT
jgi:hypothetical protein